MRVLVVGYGSIGKRHCQILSEVLNIKTVEIVTKQSLDLFKTYPNLNNVKNLDDYDYFVIASETWKHYEQLKFLCQQVENKTILVEKPLFSEFEDIKISNNRVFVAYNLRFHPIIQAIRENLQNERVLFVNVITGQYLPTWRPNTDYRTSYSAYKNKGGGVLLDLSHEIDYIQWLFGKLNKVAAINQKVSQLEISSDDIVTSIGITKNDVIVNFTMDYISKIPVRKIMIHTNECTIMGDLITNILQTVSNKQGEQINNFEINRDFTYLKMHESLLNENGKDVCTLVEALNVLATIEKIKTTNESWK